MYMLMLLDIVITGGVNLRPNFSPGVYKDKHKAISCQYGVCGLIFEGQGIYSILKIYDGRKSRRKAGFG